MISKKQVIFHPGFEKEFGKLPKPVKLKLQALMLALSKDGKLNLPNAKKLSGYKNLFEIRVKRKNKHWRGLYTYLNAEYILMLSVFNKKTQETPIKEVKKARQRILTYEKKTDK